MSNENPKYVRVAASQSFNEDEVKLVDEVFKRVLSGSDAKQLLRSPTAGLVMRKFQSMRAKIEKMKVEAANGKPMGTD
jgi:hypothetical protein